ncbi:MAG: histidine kinase dimerization/phospho-acceptor domain-containing protein, partial [Leucothrix sp.]
MDKKRLRRWLLLFFLALLLPAALLIQQSYSRLKWEVFHQHQKMAAELSRRIDNRLTRLITIEDNRTFADYSYLSGADGAQQKVPVRSPLSNYPIESEIPGVVGYFQVDAQGVLTTPLMPTVDDIYPADSKELVQRNAVRNQLRQILAANQLVRDAPAEAVEVSGAVVEEKLAPAPTVEAEVAMADIAVSSLGAESDTTTVFKSKDRSLGSSSKAQAVRKPIAFEQLKERGKQIASKNSYAQVEDIALKQNFQQKGESRRQSLAVKKKRDAVSERLERPAAKIAREQSMPKPIQQNIRIRTFESDVDPFEFSLLDSGHFVLFRKVWRNGQRYTQGLLINQKQFLSLVQDEFLSSDLSQMSGVLVAYQGNILISFSESNLQTSPIKSQALTGEQLYQVRLSDPLSDLQMIYSITDLPVGAGGRVILWLALVMASVLLGGFYIMYRLGLRQINLAAQQQDFVSAVSHELKTPLTSIRMYGEILKQGWAPEENKRRYYDFIY